VRVASIGRDGNPTVPSLESMREEISYLSYKSAVLRFSQHVKIEYYHATK